MDIHIILDNLLELSDYDARQVMYRALVNLVDASENFGNGSISTEDIAEYLNTASEGRLA